MADTPSSEGASRSGGSGYGVAVEWRCVLYTEPNLEVSIPSEPCRDEQGPYEIVALSNALDWESSPPTDLTARRDEIARRVEDELKAMNIRYLTR